MNCGILIKKIIKWASRRSENVFFYIKTNIVYGIANAWDCSTYLYKSWIVVQLWTMIRALNGDMVRSNFTLNVKAVIGIRRYVRRIMSRHNSLAERCQMPWIIRCWYVCITLGIVEWACPSTPFESFNGEGNVWIQTYSISGSINVQYSKCHGRTNIHLRNPRHVWGAQGFWTGDIVRQSRNG